jgi:hypothetical protein
MIKRKTEPIKPVSQIKEKFGEPSILRRSRDPLLDKKRSKFSL